MFGLWGQLHRVGERGELRVPRRLARELRDPDAFVAELGRLHEAMEDLIGLPTGNKQRLVLAHQVGSYGALWAYADGSPGHHIGVPPATWPNLVAAANRGPSISALIHEVGHVAKRHSVDTIRETLLAQGVQTAVLGQSGDALTKAGANIAANLILKGFDRGKKLDLWATELGWAAGGPRTPDRTVTARQQGTTIITAFKKLYAARKALRLKGIAYFAWRDSSVYKGGKDFWGLHTGLLDRRGKAKPAMKVVAKSLRKIK